MLTNQKIFNIITKQKPNPLLLQEQKGSFCFDFIIDYCKSINCKNNPKFCDECYDCKKIENLKYFDLHVIDLFNETTTKNDVANILESFKYSSLEKSGNKFLIFKGIENANKQIINLMLKSIEHPNKNTYYVFITRNINAVLETIKSRCCFYCLQKDENLINKKLTSLKIDEKYFNFLTQAFYSFNEMKNFYESESFKKIFDIHDQLLKIKQDICLAKKILNDFKKLSYFEIEKLLILVSLNLELNNQKIVFELIDNLRYKLNKTLIFNEIINII